MDNSRPIGTVIEDTNCTSTSMYLSFDAESTISSLAFKTLENSMASELNADITNTNEKSNSHINSKLEASDSLIVHYADSNEKIVKMLESVVTRGPLHPLPKNIKNDYKVLCSTPTKDRFLRSVEIEQGVDMKTDMDLKLAFSDLKMKRQQTLTPPMTTVEENKENTYPEADDRSTLSVSSSVEIITSVIEKKSYIEENQLLEREDIIEISELVKDKKVASKIKLHPVTKDIDANNHVICELKEPTNFRKSVHAPHLKTIRPNRLLSNSLKRTSLLALNSKQKSVHVEVSQIPRLLNNMMIISESNQNTQNIAAKNKQQKPKLAAEQSSKLFTNPQTEKRPFNYTQRMLVMVKTTLNSPARKMARKSVLPQIRKNIVSDFTASKTSKTILPTGQTANLVALTSATVAANLNSIVEQQIKSKITPPRKSFYMQPRIVTDSKNLPTTAIKCTSNAAIRADSGFICSVCRNKFSLKSLLNAHMRSHENGAPSFVRRSSITNNGSVATSNMLSNGKSQCKYCDKKFALVRALHIHLMENCAKIPPKEKRKLPFTELNHVEKAQLPSFFHASGQQISNWDSHANFLLSSNSSIESGKHLMLPPKSSRSSSDLMSKSPTIKLEKKDIANELAAGDGVLNKMVSPISILHKAKKTSSNMAHFGVFRTPNKTVPCHLCKKSFKSVLDYTNHSMTMHKMLTYSPPTSVNHDNNSSSEYSINTTSTSDNA